MIIGMLKVPALLVAFVAAIALLPSSAMAVTYQFKTSLTPAPTPAKTTSSAIFAGTAEPEYYQQISAGTIAYYVGNDPGIIAFANAQLGTTYPWDWAPPKTAHSNANGSLTATIYLYQPTNRRYVYCVSTGWTTGQPNITSTCYSPPASY